MGSLNRDFKESIFFLNHLAENELNSSTLSNDVTLYENFYIFNENKEEVEEFLAFEGYYSPRDYQILNIDVINEAATPKLNYLGYDADNEQILVDFNGKKYGYKQKPNGPELSEVARKFQMATKFSPLKALSWLKQNTVLSTAAIKTKPMKEGGKTSHYMFFENLHIIKKHIDKMLELDEAEVDEMLSSGHDWASDHIATSKDDIQEVCDFLCNNIK